MNELVYSAGCMTVQDFTIQLVQLFCLKAELLKRTRYAFTAAWLSFGLLFDLKHAYFSRTSVSYPKAFFKFFFSSQLFNGLLCHVCV